MAMRLGITPTFHLSYRLRLLRLESVRQFSTSYSSLLRLPISKRNLQFPLHDALPRLGLWRRSIAAVSSGPSGEGEDTADAGESKNKRSVAYDLSSGFLQTRRRTERSGLQNLAQDEDTEDWEELDTDFLENPSTFSPSRGGDNNKPRTSGVDRNRTLAGANYGTDYSNSEYRVDRSRSGKKNITSSSDEDSDGEWLEARSRGIRSRREEDVVKDPDEGFGDWTGSAEPSKNFKKSSLYKQSSGYDVKPQYQTARSVRYSPLPSPSGGPAKPPKSSSRKPPQSYSKASSSSSLSESAIKAEFDFSNKSSGGTDLSDFIPPVIKPDLPYQYSYTENPNVAPLGFREPVYSPFGPEGVNRPWTGRPPLAKSKKKPREFDSFNPPPIGKKGVKPVQQPGPFPEGQGPELGRSREEIMGAPLTEAEVKELILKARKEDRQLNLGRDGLTHNMLDLVHQHWKRRRVCKIKCKGVPTVDMDNVCRVLEEKSGGKIILRAGGSVYLFRGRNYNHKTRPVIPLMLWKPPAPIYPKLIEKIPPGLTVEEASNLRKLGRQLPPICHLGKNGVYLNLVRDVQNAFRFDDLVKVDCKNMNPSDFKKIGAKLKDLVPCILLSFERESILMWKGPKSSVESPDGVAEDNSGESTPPFRRELPEDGQEFLEETLLNEDNKIMDSAENGIIQGDEERAMYDTDTDVSEESSIEVDHDFEAAYDHDNEQDDEQESTQEKEDADLMTRYEAVDANAESDVEFDAESDVESFYHNEEPGLPSAGDSASKDEESEEAIRVFESLYQDALDSSEAFILDEPELNPDTVFEVVKSHFGGAYGAPAKPRNKRNSNEVVGRKALLRSSASRVNPTVRDEDNEDEEGEREEPKRGKKRLLKGLRFDPSVLDRVPTDASGLLQVDELARLLAP